MCEVASDSSDMVVGRGAGHPSCPHPYSTDYSRLGYQSRSGMGVQGHRRGARTG